MAKGVLVVYTAPVEGREVEFNQWYDDVHVPQLLALDGFQSATRYQVAAEQVRPGDPPAPFLALYDIEGDDLCEVVSAIGQGAKDGSITPTDASGPGTSLILFDEISERRQA